MAGSGVRSPLGFLRARSETAARQWATPLGMVFIDGGHSRNGFAKIEYSFPWKSHLVF